MAKHFCAAWLLFLTSFSYFPASYGQAVTRVYKMPQAVLQKLKTETEQRQRGECEQQNRELFSSHFYALPNKLLLLIGLPDYFCHSGSFMPITVDSQGHWEAGTVIESLSTELLTDATQGLWLISHWEIEAVFPLLHHSTDGIHWQEITLPKPTTIDCCFTYLKQVCVSDAKIRLKITGIDDMPQEYWETKLSDSLSTTPAWQKLAAPPPEHESLCQTKPLTSGDWQRKPAANTKEIQFQSATQAMTVIIPRWLK